MSVKVYETFRLGLAQRISGWMIVLAFTTAFSGAISGYPHDSARSETEWEVLFDGQDLDGWEMAGPGHFELLDDGTMVTRGGMGLFYYAARAFRDFELELEWKAATQDANSGVFVRFPEKSDDPWYAVEHGYEIQIHDGGSPIGTTGSIYSFSAPLRLVYRPPGNWNTMRIQVTGQRYRVWINGQFVNDFMGDRGREGYIGLQNHDDESEVWFRNIRAREFAPGEIETPESFAELFAIEDEREPINVLLLTATQGFRHGDAIDATKRIMEDVEQSTEFRFTMTEDLDYLTPDSLEAYDVLFFANTTLRSEGAPSAEVELGDWDNFRFTVPTGDGMISYVVAISGDPDALSGSVRFENAPAAIPLSTVESDGDRLSFTYNVPEFGMISTEGTVDGPNFRGTLQAGEFQMPVSADRVSDNDEPSEAEYVTVEQKEAIMGFIRSGKGFVGAHAATDAFYEWEEYREMIGGGLFESHPWTRNVVIEIEARDHPLVSHFGRFFPIRDEIYVLDRNPRPNVNVLMSLFMNSVHIPPDFDQSRVDHPISWTREYEGGRVFYTKLGHFADVWGTPDFLQHILQGIRYAAGRLGETPQPVGLSE